MMPGLAQFLRTRRERIVRQIEVPRQSEHAAYDTETGECHTAWEVDAVEVVDFDSLLKEIEAFERQVAGRPAVIDAEPAPPPRPLRDPFRL